VGIIGVLAVVVLVPLIFIFGFKIMPATPLGKRLLFGESGKHEPVIPRRPSTALMRCWAPRGRP